MSYFSSIISATKTYSLNLKTIDELLAWVGLKILITQHYTVLLIT